MRKTFLACAVLILGLCWPSEAAADPLSFGERCSITSIGYNRYVIICHDNTWADCYDSGLFTCGGAIEVITNSVASQFCGSGGAILQEEVIRDPGSDASVMVFSCGASGGYVCEPGLPCVTSTIGRVPAPSQSAGKPSFFERLRRAVFGPAVR